MGLDVSLYHCTDRATAKAAEDEYNRLSEAEWAKGPADYKDYTEEQKEAVRVAEKEAAERLGCTGEYESHHSVNKIEQDSAKYPDHMFKIGYMRSSYNGGGIDSVFRDIGIPRLSELFGNDSDEYEFTPHWNEVKLRVQAAIVTLDRVMTEPVSSFFSTFVAANEFIPVGEYPTTDKDAMKVFEKHLRRFAEMKEDSFMGCDYSSSEGSFFAKGAELYAAMPGFEKSFLGGKRSGVYLVLKSSINEEDGGHRLTWYHKALEIVEEMVDFVLSKPDPQNYYVHWSG
jgi:hypothetical protein